MKQKHVFKYVTSVDFSYRCNRPEYTLGPIIPGLKRASANHRPIPLVGHWSIEARGGTPMI